MLIGFHLNSVITRSFIYTTHSLNGQATSNRTLLSILHSCILNGYGTMIFSPNLTLESGCIFKVQCSLLEIDYTYSSVSFQYMIPHYNDACFLVLISLIIQNSCGINKSLLITLMSDYHRCYFH